MEIKNELDGNKGAFILRKDDKKIGELEYSIDNNVINAYHTGVRGEYEGQGLAAKLFDELVKFAREKGYQIIPSCSYIASKFKRNAKEYDDLWYHRPDEPLGDACGIKPKF